VISKPLLKIDRADLGALVAERVRAGRTLEYKRDLLVTTDEHRRELARDVSSFANASGGDLIFGVQEATDPDGRTLGYPERLLGVDCPNFEATRQRVESIVRDTLDPRVQGVAVHKVDGFERGPVIIVRIPQSWIAPHMIACANQTQFYSRNGSGKRGLDVQEIRAAFVGSLEMGNRIRRFRDDRLGKIVADETPVALKDEDPSRLVVHVVPVVGIDSAPIDLIEMSKRSSAPPPLTHPDAWSGRFNVDGYITYPGPHADLQRCYSQVFRDGAYEGVATSYLNVSKKPPQLYALTIESATVQGVDCYTRLLRSAGFDGPVVVMVSLVGVHGAAIHNPRLDWDLRSSDERFTIDRPLLTLPDVVLKEPWPDVRSALRPSFDALWQASGRERSHGYTAEGKWDEQAHH
jgi:hypothetical protein